jgi:DNA/RNA endonuclease YhcR with UshA esterase domain
MNLKKISVLFTGLAMISGLIGCDNVTSKTEPATSTAQPGLAPSQAPATPQLAADSGKVVQKLNASNYTYVRLDDGTGNKAWAALPKTQLEIGEQIVLKGGTVRRDFNSKTLNLTFDAVIFATGVIRAAGEKSAQTQTATMAGSDAARSRTAVHGLTPQTSGSSSHATMSSTKLKVEKSTAENGYTVGELFAKRASLNKQKVTVKGQVVKVNPDIMGKNWLHIQDGTGDLRKNTHDLVVTSADIADIGATISLEGILAADKDFGFGYRYDVIVEDAVLIK